MSDEEIRAGDRSPRADDGVFTETAGGVTTAVLSKLAARGDIDPDERVVLVITGEGLKTLDAVRGTFKTRTIDPTVESFRRAPPTQSQSDGCPGQDSHSAESGRRGCGRGGGRGRGRPEILDPLFVRYQELGARIAEEDGSLRRFVNVYLAGEDIRFLEGLKTPVPTGAELTILPAVAGG